MPKHTPEYGNHVEIHHRAKRRLRDVWRRAFWRKQPIVATSLYAHQARFEIGGESK